MNLEEQFARQICRTLDRGTQGVDPEITERLRAARERALAGRVFAQETVIVGTGRAALLIGGDEESHPFRMLLAILALLVGVGTAYYWNAFAQATENEEIDSALLADELPPNAYLDKGFQAWLEKHSPSGE